MRLKICFISITFTLLATQAMALSGLDRRIDAATDVIEQMTQMPERGIPPNLLANAYAVAVIPNQIKAGFMIGGSFGKGVLVVRQADGRWSNPAFIKSGGGSFGWQVGAQSSDIVLVFKNRRGVENIARGKMTLGGDANIAAGPVGRSTSASTDGSLKAEIYSYARTRGLFAGVSLKGGWIGMDNKANYSYYESGQGTAFKILSDQHIPTPAHARRFLEVLTARTPKMRQNPRSRTARSQPQPQTRDPQGAQVYGMDDAPAAKGDAIF
ncbi:MAG: lipid-binding SYLF domain-containing protein [Gammaproteobacteria bacterium]|nr:lipid-binding SYLF domain-containing protein [Gammaproteobacteria bacterium]